MTDRVILRSACHVSEVPPWRFLAPGVPPDQAAADAARALGIHDRAAVIDLFWRMRRMRADEGIEE
jgi:hypothetical protein